MYVIVCYRLSFSNFGFIFLEIWVYLLITVSRLTDGQLMFHCLTLSLP